MRPLSQLSSGTRIFIDANIFILYYTDAGALGKACRDFIRRVGGQEVIGYTSVVAVAETIHRVMLSEAANKLSLSTDKTREYLQKYPAAVRQLTDHLSVASELAALGIDIRPVTYKELHASKSVRSNFGLLTNDSLIVAVMRAHKLRHLATQDAGFDRVTGIQVWSPGE